MSHTSNQLLREIVEQQASWIERVVAANLIQTAGYGDPFKAEQLMEEEKARQRVKAGTSLTVDKLMDAIRPIYTKWYAIDEHCPQGKVLYIEQGRGHPEYFICHPLDFEGIEQDLSDYILKPLSEYK